MSMQSVTMVRVYLTEGRLLDELVKFLHDESNVQGVTVFRGITGFGKSGHMHSSKLIDTAFELPVTIEFFDTPDKVTGIVTALNERVEAGHIVSWAAEVTV